MRVILVDVVRGRCQADLRAYKHQGLLEDAAVVSNDRSADFIALDDALKSLEEIDPRKSRMVELRFFGGLSIEETAEALNVSPRTVMREWSLARDWLYRELSNGKKSAR